AAAQLEQQSTDLLGALAATILPETSTPGAKAAGVGELIPVMVRDCYDENDQKAFLKGLDGVNDRAKKEFDKAFAELSEEENRQFVNSFDKEAGEYQKIEKMVRQITFLRC